MPTRPSTLNLEKKKRKNMYGGRVDRKNTSAQNWSQARSPDGTEIKSQAKHFTMEHGANLWNNPNQVCKKVAKFYHASERDFKTNNMDDADAKHEENEVRKYYKSQTV